MNHVEWAPRFLNDSQIQAIQYSTDAALAAYGCLAGRCVKDGLGFFPIRPKLHDPGPSMVMNPVT